MAATLLPGPRANRVPLDAAAPLDQEQFDGTPPGRDVGSNSHVGQNHILLWRLPASAGCGKAAQVQSKGWRAPGGGKGLHAQDTQTVHPGQAAGTELLQAELQHGLKFLLWHS